MSHGMHHDDPREALSAALAHEAHLLPAQFPIARFVHHNTLHAYEHQPFERAVVEAARELGAEPYLDEDRYEEAVCRGRIARGDLDHAVAEAGASDAPLGPSLPSQRALRVLRLEHAVPRVAREVVPWWIAETDALSSLRGEVRGEARTQLEAHARSAGGVRSLLEQLWAASLEAAPLDASANDAGPALRPRDRLLAMTGVDADAHVTSFLVRFLAAYLDQGIAYWPMPERDGLWRCFARVHRDTLLPPWLAGLRSELETDRDGEAQALHELALLGAKSGEFYDYVHATLQALPGWGGMVHVFETRPDLAPGEAPPTRLVDLLAIRMLLDRCAVTYFAREAGMAPPLRARAVDDASPRHVGDALAVEVFAMAQRLGWAPATLREQGGRLAAELAAFDGIARRGVYHLAYERHYRVEVLDALAISAPKRIPDPDEPLAQLVLCIDEREESYRRALEETEPRLATYGYAGNFDVFMVYEGHGAPFPVPLCPPVVTPKHRVRERPIGADGLGRQRVIGAVRERRRVASRTLVRGSVLSLAGLGSLLPLVGRTLFPGWFDRVTSASRSAITPQTKTRLELTRDEEVPADEDGLFPGFTHREQAGIVGRVLRAIGLTRGFSPLVAIVGHGSTSVNNPHASAYNCGACAGGRGTANARAFALMANTPEVRRILAEEGLAIPDSTTFLGAYHDTATDELVASDLEAVPASTRALWASLQPAFDRAAELDAHERCRRFADAPLDLTPRDALRHAVGRTVDLAQPRPEYCHATNAVCVVGRRSLTRGLYLDRRAFLVSYDPTGDDERSSLLERLLAQAGPVGAGINLEYYFSRVDQARYGSGTKLPHNVTGLIGVMNGHASDLRTGLHWQTVELHEPMRLLVVAEATTAALEAIVARHDVIRRLVANRWILVAAVDPGTGLVSFLEKDGFRRHTPGGVSIPKITTSRAYYTGHREHLRPARFASAEEAAC